MQADARRKVLLLCGPTAVGKSAIAMDVAKQRSAELVCADARTVFRGLDIGTAKPTADDRAAVVHHLLDICDPQQSYDAAQFMVDAREAIDAMAYSVLPIMVGGSGLYIAAALDGLSHTSPADPRVRAVLQQRLAAEGRDALYGELANVDPRAAARYADRNPVRVVRALEYFVSTGKPFSSTWDMPRNAAPYAVTRIGLTRPREALYEIINQRCVLMWEHGLVEETQRMLDAGVTPHCQAMHTVGYVEVLAYLHGTMDRPTALARMQQVTRQYAKRQLTWFRADERITWLDAGASDVVDAIIAMVDAP